MNISEVLTTDERVSLPFDRPSLPGYPDLVKQAFADQSEPRNLEGARALLQKVESKSAPSVYHEVVRRASEKEKAALEAKLASLPDKQKWIQKLLSALKEGHWQSPIFQTKDYTCYALEALKQGKLTQEAFATVQIFWEVQQAHPKKDIEASPLFKKDGSVNEDARSWIKETFRARGAYQKKSKDAFFLSEPQIDQLFEEMRSLPKAEQTIWKVPDNLKIKGLELTISQRIYAIGINIFGRPRFGKTRLVPTLGLMQSYLNVKYGSNAVKINPVLGLSSDDDLRKNGVEDKRDMGLHHRAVLLGNIADSFAAPWYDFLYHDFYHAIVISSIPKELRRVYIKIFDILEKTIHVHGIKKNTLSEISLIVLRDRYLDMEFPDSNELKKSTTSPNDIFWQHFTRTFASWLGIETAGAVDKITVLKEIMQYLAAIPALKEGPVKLYAQVNAEVDRMIKNADSSEGVEFWETQRDTHPATLIYLLWKQAISR
jgi:hypothetical protein